MYIYIWTGTFRRACRYALLCGWEVIRTTATQKALAAKARTSIWSIHELRIPPSLPPSLPPDRGVRSRSLR